MGVEFDPVVGAGFAYAAEEVAAVSEFEGCHPVFELGEVDGDGVPVDRGVGGGVATVGFFHVVSHASVGGACGERVDGLGLF